MKLRIGLIIFALVVGGATQSFGGTSLSLREALDLSLSANPTLLSAQAKSRAAQASVRQASGSFLPQLSLGAGYTVYQEPNIITPIHEIGVFPALDDAIYNLNLNVSVPIFDGGRRKLNRDIAKASVKENNANHKFTRQSLIQQIAELFLFAKQVEAQSELVNKRLEALNLRYRDIVAMETEGRVPPGDVALVASTLADAQSDSIAVSVTNNQIQLRLGLLVGKFEPINLTLESTGLTSSYFEESSLVSGAANTNVTGPALEAALARQQKSSVASSIAKNSFWPEVSAFGSYAYRSGSDWNPTGEWVAGIQISLPLFQGGTRISKMYETRALANASHQAAKFARLEQNVNLQITYDDYVSHYKRFKLLTRAEEEKLVSVNAQEELYKAGRIPLRDLNVQELELLQLQFNKNELLFSARSALLRYEMLAGTLSNETALTIAGGL
ncbi:TolC family protein [bacterium AH-315-J21]|nr:TolC family protein [bacterium AH-315-J21]